MTLSRKREIRISPFIACLLFAICMSANAQSNKGADNGKPFQDVQEAVTAEQAATIAAIEAEAAIREAADLELQDQIDEINGVLDGLSAMSMTLDEVQADVESLQTTIDIMTGQLNALEADTDANADKIAGLLTDIAQLDGELASKQDILDGACDEGSTLRAIYPDGGFLCEVNDGGSSSAIATTVRVSGWETVPRSRTVRNIDLSCPDEFQLSGGGYESYYNDYRTRFQILVNMPLDNTTWRLSVLNQESLKGTERVRIRMVCVH